MLKKYNKLHRKILLNDAKFKLYYLLVCVGECVEEISPGFVLRWPLRRDPPLRSQPAGPRVPDRRSCDLAPAKSWKAPLPVPGSELR